MTYIFIILSVVSGILNIVVGIIDLKNKNRRIGLLTISIAFIFFILAVNNYNRNFKDNTPPSTTINNYYYTGEN